MDSYSLYQLNEYIRRVIALNFREPIWIEAEIVQARDSRGHFYLELAEKKDNSDEIIARASAAIWYRKFLFLKKKLGDVLHDLLKEGTQVRLKCSVEFNEKYGLKLIVEDIDPRFTFGQHELRRQEIIKRLQDEGLMELNKGEVLPEVIKHVAVISSSGAAGYQDFIQQLLNNSQGYTFNVTLFDVAVQGQKVESETVDAIQQIISDSQNYDAAVIIRGGGSKLDLAGYDNYQIAERIALSQIPFITGIGHDIDVSIVDMVACKSLKTPTAVADFLIEHNLYFEARLEQMVQSVFGHAQKMIQDLKILMNSLSEQIMSSGHRNILSNQQQIELLKSRLRAEIAMRLTNAKHRIESLQTQVELKNPEVILKSGYGYIMKGGKQIRKVKNLNKADEIEITLIDGSKTAQIQ